MQASFTSPADPPRNYFVPNFGKDKEIIDSEIDLAQQEKSQGHKFSSSFTPAAEPPRDYPVPNFGKDNEIITAQKNIAD